MYLSTSDLLSFSISNTDKHEFSSIWKWIRCCNDVRNNVDCVIKRDVYPSLSPARWPSLSHARWHDKHTYLSSLGMLGTTHLN